MYRYMYMYNLVTNTSGSKSPTMTHSRWVVIRYEPLKKALCIIDCGVYGRVRADPLSV